MKAVATNPICDGLSAEKIAGLLRQWLRLLPHPWTIKQEFTRQSEQANRIYYEPRCNEGNYALPGAVAGRAD